MSATTAIARPRPASTLLVVRDAASGIEVLMLRRALSSSFMPNAWVFPGGALDAADATDAMAMHCVSVNDSVVSQRLGLERGGLVWLVAAIRECFEECGLLLARNAAGGAIDWRRADYPADLLDLRRAVLTGAANLESVCARLGAVLACDDLVYVSRWVTPPQLPKRFDTRFFVARAPVGQPASLASEEVGDLAWVTPQEALARGASEQWRLMRATRHSLEMIAPFNRCTALLADLRARTDVPFFAPQIATADASRAGPAS